MPFGREERGELFTVSLYEVAFHGVSSECEALPFDFADATLRANGNNRPSL